MSAPRPRRTLLIGATTYEIWPGHVRTILPGGGAIPAAPQDSDAYRATALRLGYGADTWAMCRDHDLLHIAVAHWLGLPESPVLGRVARGEPAQEADYHEEAAVLAVQSFARAAGIDLIDLWARQGVRGNR